MSLTLLMFSCVILQHQNTVSQTLDQGNWEIQSKMGAAVDFSCLYAQVEKPYYFFWYQQKPGRHPVCIKQISYLGDEHPNEGFVDVHRFTVKRVQINYDDGIKLTNKGSIPSDSAVYFCAVNHKSEKFLKFGDGNRLRLLPESDVVATAYLHKADTDGPTACMVKDSGPLTASVFLSGETVPAEPTMATGESSYGLVAVATCKAIHCRVKQGEMDIFASENNQCLTNTDEKMNFLHLTILGLRSLCVKMVVLSGLLTMHLLTYSA
ncbi:T cell receptor alpha chain MC.7.G5-like isoform X2 [Alosa pseudoharengus]|uniref:T cell receptor alpha chain MC.7.G5-like isoform X2 n=1 Tax=Alosa pseudoharengus TaxID=34774 RepID=UPI003F8C5682